MVWYRVQQYVAYGISGPSNFVDIIIWIDSQSDMPIRSIQRYLKGLSLRYLLWQEPLQKKAPLYATFLFHSKDLLVFYPPDTIPWAFFGGSIQNVSIFWFCSIYSLRWFLISIRILAWTQMNHLGKNGDKNLIRNPWWKTRVFSDDELGGEMRAKILSVLQWGRLTSRFCLAAPCSKVFFRF